MTNTTIANRINEVSKAVSRYGLDTPAEEGLTDCTIGIPYSGDGSYGLAAAIRAVGIPAEVMTPTCDWKTYEYADRFVITQTCEPFRIQTGDILAWLEKKSKAGIPQDKLAVFEPSAGGPCRLGQYADIIRYFMNEAGYEGVRLMSPSSGNDYMDMQLPRKKMVKVIRLALNGMYMVDILYNALLRVRPYEKISPEEASDNGTPSPAEKIYQTAITRMCKQIEKGGSRLTAIMRNAAEEMQKLDFERGKRYPIALIAGEFFMRTHPGANHDIARVLEREFNRPLETMLVPYMEWFHYVNQIKLNQSWHDKEWKNIATGSLKKLYMARQTRKFWQPFKELLKGREPHDPMKYVKSLEEVTLYHSDIQGESPLSIGLTYLFTENHFQPHNDAVISGICHIGPHQCMQETVATSVSQALIRKKQQEANNKLDKVLPYVDIIFTDEPEPQWRPKLASFVYQCYARRQLLTGV